MSHAWSNHHHGGCKTLMFSPSCCIYILAFCCRNRFILLHLLKLLIVSLCFATMNLWLKHFLTPDVEVTVMQYFPRKNCTYSQTPAKVHILLRLCWILNVHLWAKSWSSRGNLRNCSKMQWDVCTCWNYLQRKQMLGPIKMSRTGAFLTHQIAS